MGDTNYKRTTMWATAMAVVYLGTFLEAILHFTIVEHTLDPINNRITRNHTPSGWHKPEQDHCTEKSEARIVQSSQTRSAHHRHSHCQFTKHLSKSSLTSMVSFDQAACLPPDSDSSYGPDSQSRYVFQLYFLAPKHSPPT